MSETAPYSFDAQLSVCIDFKSPESYLAKDPTYALADELQLAIDWLPLVVAPATEPKAVAADDDRGTRHRRMRAQYFERDIQRYARHRGLEIRDIYRSSDSSMAAIGLLWVKNASRARLRDYIDRVFERFWKHELDIEDAASIAGILEEIGVEAEGFGEHLMGEGKDALEQVQGALRTAGLFNVPGYVVDGEIFFGRQHLPMIRWLLTGEQGDPPI